MSELADRLRAMLEDDPNVGEVRMFGGICFTLNGNMLVVSRGKDGLLVRVGQERAAQALARPGVERMVERMVMRGREMKDYVTVAEDGLDDAALRDWIAMATAHVGLLPPKAGKKPEAAAKKSAGARRVSGRRQTA